MARGRITVALGLTIVILASNAGAKPKAEIDSIGEIKTDDSSHSASNLQLNNTEDREHNFSDATPTLFSDEFPPIMCVAAPRVPEEYIYTPDIGNHKLHTHAKTWADARKVCRREGGDLAIINSPEEAQVIRNVSFSSESHVDSSDTNYVFIGVTDAGEDHARIVTDGRTLEQAGFADWELGEPNDISGIRNCGTLKKNGKLTDKACWKRLAFVCEFPVPNEVFIPGMPTPRRPVTVNELRQNGYTSTPGIGIHALHVERKTWFEARSVCQEEGGDLTILNSPEEAWIVANFIDLSRLQSAFIGFNDITREGHFVTVGGIHLEDAGFTGWATYEPSNGSDWWDEDCGSLQRTGYLNDVSCWSLSGFVCELPSLNYVPSPVPIPQQGVTTSNQDGYTYTPGIGFHKINRYAETWRHARHICEEQGADLAIINSEREALAVGRLIDESYPHFESSDPTYVLLGFNDIHEDGKYVTIDGRSLKKAGYEKWAPGKPNKEGDRGDSCGSMDSDGMLNDVHCFDHYAFACERPIILHQKEGRPGIPEATGPPGPAGPRGIPGIKGDRGFDGRPGLSGYPGIPGSPGMRGLPGAAGPRGPAGPQGPQGVPGARGETGPPGPAGLNGQEGDRGEREMEKGLQGYSGLPGLPGLDGPTGPPGLKGEAGVTGPRGEPGLGYDAVCVAVHSILEQIRGHDSMDGGKARTIPGDNVTLEQCQKFMTKKYGQDTAGGSSQNSAQRDGQKESPAKTCKDLFLAYPDKPSGEYWIDPNGDDVSDAILVRCDAERSTTCVQPDSSREPNFTYTGYEREVWLSEIDEELQIKYAAASSQINALQLLSDSAEQNVTYHCFKSVGYFDSESQINERGLKLLAWNDVELKSHGSRQFRYDMISDGCRDRLDKWKETVITYRTDKAFRLPVTDVYLGKLGEPGQSFAVEIGEVCFG